MPTFSFHFISLPWTRRASESIGEIEISTKDPWAWRKEGKGECRTTRNRNADGYDYTCRDVFKARLSSMYAIAAFGAISYSKTIIQSTPSGL